LRLSEFALERYFARHGDSAPLLLSSSTAETRSANHLLSLADAECRELWDNLDLGYTDTRGLHLLRQEIASLYATVSPEDVVVFAGAEEAIFILANVALNPGDGAAVIWPAYQSLYEVARAVGADVSLLPLRHEEEWSLDPKALRTLVRPSTRLIVTNLPHNPTGALPDLDVFHEVVRIAREVGASLLSDEVYRGLEHDSEDRLPAAVDVYERAVSIGVMSKSFGLPGLRIGWIATHDGELLKRALHFKDYTTICNSAPSEVLALVALRAREKLLARNLGTVRGNLPHAERFFAEWQGIFDWVRPRAGCLAFPRLLAELPIDTLCEDLARSEGVMLLPGTVYGHEGNFFRLGFGHRNFSEALARLDRFARRIF
jgi:aspartate/methionine/tyrosine aminotransferase